jgi:hypothetical protein
VRLDSDGINWYHAPIRPPIRIRYVNWKLRDFPRAAIVIRDIRRRDDCVTHCAVTVTQVTLDHHPCNASGRASGHSAASYRLRLISQLSRVADVVHEADTKKRLGVT